MRYKQIMRKCVWIMLAALMSLVVFQAGYDASGNIRIDGEPTFRYSMALLWEILTGIAVFVPVWLLTLLGLARCFLGENWFPFAEKIPVRITKKLLAASAILMVCVLAAERIYFEYAEYPVWDRYTIEGRFDGWQSLFAWILFYSMLLYIEQWSIRRKDSRQSIRKRQAWVTVTLLVTQLIVLLLGCVDLWYIPLSYVDSPNRLEDYYLWWFSLYSAVSVLPLWFFSARKTIRLFKNNKHWLTLSSVIPAKVSALIALASIGLMILQIQECRYWNGWTEIADVPEYGQAAAMGHLIQTLMWGLVLFYAICLLVKQIHAARRARREQL